MTTLLFIYQWVAVRLYSFEPTRMSKTVAILKNTRFLEIHTCGILLQATYIACVLRHIPSVKVYLYIVDNSDSLLKPAST
mgnify:CR=1 FL=1